MAAMPLDSARRKAVYFAQLAEQAERYDEMAEHMQEVKRLTHGEFTEEEQRLVSVAHSNTASARTAAWRSISDVAKKATDGGAGHLAELAFKYRDTVEDELDSICTRTRDHLIIPEQAAMTDEEAVFYQKMKAETHRHAVELGCQSRRAKADEGATHQAASSKSVHGDATEACKAAPSPAGRHLPSCGSISPRGRVPASVAARRLCDLLLEFPEAAIGGVRWSTLLRSYTELYDETLDLASLGHETASAAARALLTNVYRHQCIGQALGQVPHDQSDPIVAVDDAVALTPLPGFAGSWPALYTSLCALVRSSGAEDVEVSGAEGPPGRILLMSKLRPLLDSVKEDGQEQTASAASASHARSLLLSHVRPVSKFGKDSGKDCGTENGLSFRGEDGSLRKLQKLGHVVKAALQWRDQRLLWRHSTGGHATAIDEALVPKLELVFSKRLNNLVLCLYDTCKATSSCIVAESSPAQAVVAQEERASKPSDQRSSDIYDNPFKWQPLIQNIDSRIAAAARPFARHFHSSSNKNSSNSNSSSSSSSPAMDGNVAGGGETAPAHGSEGLHVQEQDQPQQGWVAPPTQHIASPMISGRSKRWRPKKSKRSLSRERRSPSVPVRARSVDREESHEDRTLCREAAELRSSSAPPQRQCWADIVDDPDEALLLDMFAHSPKLSRESSRPPCAANESGTASAVHAIDKQAEFARRLQQCTSPKCNERCTTRGKCIPSCGGRASSCTTRGRSSHRGATQLAADEDAVPQEKLEQRCTSEPPYIRSLNVFDDPFEPPPQDMHWVSLDMPTAPVLTSGCARKSKFLQMPTSETVTPTTSAPSPPTPRSTPEPTYHQQLWTTKRWASPKRLDLSDAVMDRAAIRAGRARSLTRSHEGAMHRKTSTCTSAERYNHIEPRCTSEPAHYRCSEGYDDPFEPPPQGFWQSPLEQGAFTKADTRPFSGEPSFASVLSTAASSDAAFESEGQDLPHKPFNYMVATGHFTGGKTSCAPARARSLTPMSRSDAWQASPRQGRKADNASARCTSEPPQHRIDSVFDDPFEPPPQEMWWYTPALAPSVPVSRSLCYDDSALHLQASPFLL